MTRGDLDIQVWARPVKPVAFGMTILMVTLTVLNVTNTGAFGDNPLGDVVAVLTGSAAICLVAGWVGRWQRVAEAGLLLAFIAYTLRAVFIVLVVGPSEEGLYLSVGAAVIAGGSYLLEAWAPDSRGK